MRRAYRFIWLGWTGFLCAALIPSLSAGELSTTVTTMEEAASLNLKQGKPKQTTGPGGAKALLFTSPFQGRIDLKAKGVDPKDYDLIKLAVKADRGAFLRVGVENHPAQGDISYWYVLDTMRAGFGWRTIWVDLKRPEEIKRGNDSSRARWRKGMDTDSAGARGVQITGRVKDLGSKDQGSGRKIALGPIRFVKEAVHLDWDQRKAPYTWGDGADLVFTYPLTVTNRLDKAATAELRVEPFDAEHAKAALAPASVPLAAGETKTVAATLTLPAAVASKQDPLYCERFSVFASAKGVTDSEVTILRSSDPIHLTVTVPIPEENLAFPLLARPSELPGLVLQYDQEMAKRNAKAKTPKQLIDNAMAHGLYQYGKSKHGVGQFRKTLIASAYLYDFTGKKEYLETATTLLKALPDIWEKFFAEYEKRSIREISSGIVCRWNDKNHYVLSLGWLVMGTQRSPYYYGTGGNGAGGGMSSLAYAFDIVAPKLDEETRQHIVQAFFVPAGIQARNHLIGDGNQQATANVTALYAGLVTRNWPLVSYAYSSGHGMHDILEWCFDDDGVQIRKNYQTYTMRPLFWTMELLHGCGLTPYKRYEDRLEQIVKADTKAKGMGGGFQDHHFWKFIKTHRLKNNKEE